MAKSNNTISKIAAILGMLGSAHDGEVVNAARKAEEWRKAAGLTWLDLLTKPSFGGASSFPFPDMQGRVNQLQRLLSERDQRIRSQSQQIQALHDRVDNLNRENQKLKDAAKRIQPKPQNVTASGKPIPPGRRGFEEELDYEEIQIDELCEYLKQQPLDEWVMTMVTSIHHQHTLGIRLTPKQVQALINIYYHQRRNGC